MLVTNLWQQNEFSVNGKVPLRTNSLKLEQVPDYRKDRPGQDCRHDDDPKYPRKVIARLLKEEIFCCVKTCAWLDHIKS